MSDSERLIQEIERLREKYQIPPDLFASLHRLVGLIRWAEVKKK